MGANSFRRRDFTTLRRCARRWQGFVREPWHEPRAWRSTSFHLETREGEGAEEEERSKFKSVSHFVEKNSRESETHGVLLLESTEIDQRDEEGRGDEGVVRGDKGSSEGTRRKARKREVNVSFRYDDMSDR